jgi:hypothetical protein
MRTMHSECVKDGESAAKGEQKYFGEDMTGLPEPFEEGYRFFLYCQSSLGLQHTSMFLILGASTDR